MLTLGPIAFATPWLLLGLLILPILWLLLRAVPPAPIRRRFPGVALLLGLSDDDSQSDRTPWWLLLLRLLAIAAIITAFAGPVLNPKQETAGNGPLLVIMDGTWADARDWTRRIDRVDAALAEAARDGRTAALVTLTDLPPEPPVFQDAQAVQQRLPNVMPRPFAPDAEALIVWADSLTGAFDTFWLSDGIARDSRDDLLASLETHGTVTAFESSRPVFALRPAQFVDDAVSVTVLRAATGNDTETTVTAVGLDPAGVERRLSTATAAFAATDLEATATFDLPPELRNRVTRFEIQGIRSAGVITLADDALKRREVALLAGASEREALDLLSPLHYLEQALIPTADLIEGSLEDVLLANPDVIILADVATLTAIEADAMLDWVDAGGLLVRFAGPRLAASDISRTDEDPLMPVRLRVGGRSIGGAMSWGEPKELAPFADNSPFFGLPIPDDVAVTAQVMAQPDPTLADRVIAQLADGTPLVTRKSSGNGSIVLFHVTANAEWSTLPLSGLFVQMLERLAISTRPATPSVKDLAGTTWQPEDVLDAFGELSRADTLPGVAGEDLAEAVASADLLPGLYAGEDRRIALNVTGPEDVLAAATWPARIAVEGLNVVRETLLKGWLLAAALVLLSIDIIASLALSGRLRGPRATSAAVVLMAMMIAPNWADAQDDEFAIASTADVVLAYVITGDTQVDEMSDAGLYGLSNILFQRTSIEPSFPVGIDLETDELAFFPFIYWPVTADQQLPTREAYARLNRYLRSGGMILFDTRDADLARFGSASPEGRKLQAIARGLDIPALEPIPQDHVLTRTFYLLQDFPGRHASRDIWVEAAAANAQAAEGMPFRDLNDGVTPVVAGGNDWASAWATDRQGTPLVPIGRGLAGERQREIALRFGVNLIMHVLTGNYKSDQVHVPALLDRLGQ
ncbi:DUF4159 domain-containing protein [Octadecabacter sp. 1_MG-2023]|uniref:DUF4159 domain-containing protein n=1 Tax=unclassified Octadecabacter TaxID=196158 RepID=UPI001C097671|nr:MULTISPECIES: DUF4159 domain-containing protein [unclassified Octadecabacter]MBU2994321.1 DUF4159 domain-containing protein [Octadecabacter sp. B2R22]MDO6734390.1 DUF4159 domain-containing protein [Octadecabacter sp. 1_MG-2023]